MPLGQILKAVYFYILLKLLRQKNLNLSDSSKQGLLSFPHPFDTDSDLFARLCQQAAEKDIVEEKGSMLVKTGSLMHQHQSCSGTKQGSLPLLSSTAITLLVFTKKKKSSTSIYSTSVLAKLSKLFVIASEYQPLFKRFSNIVLYQISRVSLMVLRWHLSQFPCKQPGEDGRNVSQMNLLANMPYRHTILFLPSLSQARYLNNVFFFCFPHFPLQKCQCQEHLIASLCKYETGMFCISVPYRIRQSSRDGKQDTTERQGDQEKTVAISQPEEPSSLASNKDRSLDMFLIRPVLTHHNYFTLR